MMQYYIRQTAPDYSELQLVMVNKPEILSLNIMLNC